MTRRVSVVIPTLDGGPLFLRVIAAVLDQRAEPFEVIVVDSGSRDGTLEALASLPVRVLKVPRAAFDHGLTRNFGIGMAEGEIVALLVQDALPASERWLAGLVAALDSEPRAAGAYSRQIPRPEHPAFVRVPFEAYAASSPERRVQELSHESWEAMAPAERLRAATFDDVASAVRKSAWRDHPSPRRASARTSSGRAASCSRATASSMRLPPR
ncbi:MAG: glycosyltransferase family A protein [Acidobacteriota bacterium]